MARRPEPAPKGRAAAPADRPEGRSGGRVKYSPVGASPGVLIADPSARQSALRLTLVSPQAHRTIDNASLQDVIDCRGEWPVLWLDCVGLANVELIAAIGRTFALHPLALEDVVNVGQRPKVDFYDDHTFVVVSMIDDPATMRYEQITLFVGDDFVVTFQEREGDPFDPVRKRIAVSASHRIRTRKADYLAYALIDSIVDSFFPILETTAAAIDSLEDELMRGAEKHQVQRMHALRRGMIGLKRAVWPLRDAVAGLVRADVPYIHAETKVFLNDTLDHAVRLIDTVDTNRDMLTGLIEMHLSLSQARTNDIISFLTIVSVIFIPLTFLVGVWGMNFDSQLSPWNMPELHTYYGYPLALAAMALIAAVLVAFFRWRKWL